MTHNTKMQSSLTATFMRVGRGTATAVVIGILVAIVGRSRTPLTRLCSLTWHRGDRFGASMLFFGVVAPRFSQRRIEKQKAALEAAQRGVPTYPNRIWSFPFKIK